MAKSVESARKVSSLIKQVKKRDGKLADFDIKKIFNAIFKAMLSTEEGTEVDASRVAEQVILQLSKTHIKNIEYIPTVEEVQDAVERELMWDGFVETAKAYILYRSKRAELRSHGIEVPDEVKNLTNESKKYFRNQLAEFIYYRTYARWIEDKNRRETWIETVDRYMNFMIENIGKKLTNKEYAEVREAILKHEAMPSMRLLQFAGEAARKTNVCAYNCSYIAPSQLQDFGEIMYILMCGTGVGFSVESQNVQALPQIKPQTGKILPVYVVEDTREGWANALTHGIKSWFDGNDARFDFSKLRPAGARLKTMGGRSSGPDPLRSVLEFVCGKIFKRQGRRLSNIDVHDIVCKIGEVVIAGGVRRSALISLSDLDDQDMRNAKNGQFYSAEPQRMMANNSAVYNEKPNNVEFLDEWIALMKSGSGERGIFNRGGLKKTLPKRRMDALNGDISNLGTNPCGEIILQSKQFCNLSEIVARTEDSEESLLRKIRVAVILGTYQATLTNFPYLSKEWNKNCEQERLLGISITGQWDCLAIRRKDVLQKIKDEAVKINKQYAKKLGINQAACVTCVKPSGTLSQMVDCASGMHPRHAEYYIRRVRIASSDPMFRMLKDQGVPFYPEVGQSVETANTFVLEFPVKAPAGSIFKNDISASEQLEHWKLVKENYTEHNPSVTISVGEEEWVEVANWLYKNWELVGGLSFLPRDNHIYQLAPYEQINKEKYDELAKRIGLLDFSKIVIYENEDMTENKKELACVGNVCELVI